ncbi:MAG: plasmid partitioning protein RepB [Allorhizobium sp.]
MTSPRERNQRMKSLFAGVGPEDLTKPSTPSQAEADKRRVGSAAVKSMDRAFVSIEEENKRLHDQLVSSESIVEIDPGHIIPSFVNDRLDIEGDRGFSAFVEGIREAGQKLPILVRPLPGRPGYYQTAYGHRRVRACQILKRPVKAIVRELSDEELVISQGIENSERLNLSFIEQALFALALKDRGYSRETISHALGRKEGQQLAYISLLTNTAAMIPSDLIRKIGPAPSIGRPKWEKLGALLSNGKLSTEQSGCVDELLKSSVWDESDSDQRFGLVFGALDKPVKRAPDLFEIAVAGGNVLVAKRSGATTQIAIPDSRIPGLSAWLIARLPELVEEFHSSQREGAEMK